MKRISLSELDAAHAYLWLAVYWRRDPIGRFGACALCERIGKRLERFIGAAEVRRIRGLVAVSAKQPPRRTAASRSTPRRRARGTS